MAGEKGARPVLDEKGRVKTPKFTGLGLKKEKLEEMAQRPVMFDGRFCVTGVFAYGSREDVELAIKDRGGVVVKAVPKSGCTVVVGTGASDGWIEGMWGRKIEDAARYIKEGCPVTLITEDVLVAALLATEPMEQETPAAKKERYAKLIASGDLTAEEADLLRRTFCS